MPIRPTEEVPGSPTDLTIQEFDQWTNPQNARLDPTVCTCLHDFVVDPLR